MASRAAAPLQFFPVAGDEEQAIVGRRPEEDHDDENLRGLEDLEVEPGGSGGSLGQQGNQVRRQDHEAKIDNNGTTTRPGAR